MPSYEWVQENLEKLEELGVMNLSAGAAASKVEDDVKELAILLARINHPSRVDTGNGKDAAWRQWVCYSRVILAAGYRK